MTTLYFLGSDTAIQVETGKCKFIDCNGCDVTREYRSKSKGA